MKKLMMIFFATILLSTSSYAGGFRVGVSFDVFYNDLSPYGDWIEIERDVIVWRPRAVSRYWKPYAMGRWVWTSQGWYWDSYEPFGWATYHYGRWFNDEYYGWVWLPDYEWAPAWVEWRHSDVYIGWAPLPPYAVFKQRHGIRFTVKWHSHADHWHFISYNYFGRSNLHYYLERPEYNHRIIHRTKYRTNYKYRDGRIYNGGIDRQFVERRSGRRIETRTVSYSHDENYRNRADKSRTGDVVAYRPDGTKHREHASATRNGIKRGSGKSSLRTSKIPERSITKNRSSSGVERNVNRESTRSRNNIKRNDVNRDRSVTSERNVSRSLNRTEVNRSKATSKSPAVKSRSTRESSSARSRNMNKTDNSRVYRENKSYGNRSNNNSRSQFTTPKSMEQKNSEVRTNSRTKVKSSVSSARNTQRKSVKNNTRSMRKGSENNAKKKNVKRPSVSGRTPKKTENKRDR